MKVRAGFVANSSSSSFIILGIKIKKKELSSDQEGLAYSTGLELESIDENDFYIGRVLAHFDSSDVFMAELDPDLTEKKKWTVERLKRVLGKRKILRSDLKIFVLGNL